MTLIAISVSTRKYLNRIRVRNVYHMEELESKETTKRRYNFQKALRKCIDKYKEKGVGINSVKIEWGKSKKQ